MYDNIPNWLSVPLIVILSLTALYKCYILPGYVADNEATAENEKGKKGKKMNFKHGDKVTMHDAYGMSHDGFLHLPEGSTRGNYGIHTLILPGGRKFRSEGRLYACEVY